MNWVTAIKDTMEKLRAAGGDDWHEELAREFTAEDRQRLREAFDRLDVEELAVKPAGKAD